MWLERSIYIQFDRWNIRVSYHHHNCNCWLVKNRTGTVHWNVLWQISQHSSTWCRGNLEQKSLINCKCNTIIKWPVILTELSAGALGCHHCHQSAVLLLASDIVAEFSCTYMLLKMFLIFTNEEYSKMHVVCGCCGGNVGASAKIYKQQFCEWLQQQLQSLPDLLLVSVARFACDEIEITRNYHSAVKRRPHEVIQSNFQQWFWVNVWCLMLGKHLLWPYFMGGHSSVTYYRNFLESKLLLI